MKKNIMVINKNREEAQLIKENLPCPNTNIFCMQESLLQSMEPLARCLLEHLHHKFLLLAH